MNMESYSPEPATEANVGTAQTFVYTHKDTAGTFNARIIGRMQNEPEVEISE